MERMEMEFRRVKIHVRRGILCIAHVNQAFYDF